MPLPLNTCGIRPTQSKTARCTQAWELHQALQLARVNHPDLADDLLFHVFCVEALERLEHEMGASE